MPHQVFQRTGRHPDLERRPVSDALPSLPERDPNRQHVFLDLRQGRETLGAQPPVRRYSSRACTKNQPSVSCYGHRTGRLLVEVFEDAAPLATRRFLNRCREGSSEALQGTCVHRLVPDQGLFFGTSRGCATLQQPRAALPRCAATHKALHQRAGMMSTQCGRSTVECMPSVCYVHSFRQLETLAQWRLRPAAASALPWEQQAPWRRGGAALPRAPPPGRWRGVDQPQRRGGGHYAGQGAVAGPQPPGATQGTTTSGSALLSVKGVLQTVCDRGAWSCAAQCRLACLCSVCLLGVFAPLQCPRVTCGAQVVGRVHDGEDLLARLNTVQTDRDDVPLQRTVVVACGLTDNQASNPAS